MIISTAALTALVGIALTITIAAPLLLLWLLIRDWTKRQLW
ncbi:MAG TPA: hypothetical protein VE175_10130 [Woeseiaceae bacterium]|nr:hypothetical protein [Woeseiaceae bacterium]